ncbi:helix-turn-helix domain-containing protein [Roseomonas chloroacetimidivorans]|uniref:helix-turn-helix domain-containing protein n=1 Tax=Roseomonas chloroacetimidivorans TaxID=1766656 RepID=UPI003C70D2F3
MACWIEEGLDLERDGVVRWNCRDLQERIRREFSVTLYERTVGKLLTKLRFYCLSARPQRPQSDPAAQAAFGKASLIG